MNTLHTHLTPTNIWPGYKKVWATSSHKAGLGLGLFWPLLLICVLLFSVGLEAQAQAPDHVGIEASDHLEKEVSEHLEKETPAAFGHGEFLLYKIQYGLLNAGYTSLELNQVVRAQDTLLHAVGKGWTTGMVSVLFKVEDQYESYFRPDDQRPMHFIRKVQEGNYTKDLEVFFDYQKHQAKIVDHKKSETDSVFIQNNIKDMLSSFYHVRSFDMSQAKENDTLSVNMYFDKRMNPTKVLVLGRDQIKTPFGKVRCLKIRPLVLEGRVFKDEENVTLWVSDDHNKIPLRIKASIYVGSVKAELVEYQNLAHPLGEL